MNYCNYTNLKLGKETAKSVTEEDINREIETILNKSISFRKKEGKSVKGDIVNIDFEGFVDGVPFEGGKAEKYDLELGSNTFIPGFEDQLIDKNVDDNVDVKVTFPEEYHAENLKGKEAIFKCKINEIKEKEIPTFDDSFASKNGFENVSAFKEAITNKIKEQNELQVMNAYITKICDYLSENSDISLSEEEISKRINEIISYYENSISQYGVTLESYLQMSNMSLDDFKEKLKPDAEKSLKIDMVYNHIAEKEQMSISEEELNAYLENIKRYYHFSDEQMNQLKNERTEQFKNELIRQKVSEFLFAHND